jgi:hypothetical protein
VAAVFTDPRDSATIAPAAKGDHGKKTDHKGTSPKKVGPDP